MMRTLAQTGNGWMTFKDAANRTCNQTAESGNVVHLSNLCTEILEVSSDAETAVCNLGSINLGAHVRRDGAGRRPAIDWERLRATVRTAVVYLDRVIDINYYPSPQAARSNPRWRPIGLGVMGLQDVFFALRLPFDADRARELSTRIAEEIYLTALETSCDLAAEHGPHPAYGETRAARGELQPDLWAVTPTQTERWDGLRARIAEHGLRNSLLIAIAPTATIASIAGCYECIEPQVSNVFKRETLSGEFLQINTALVAELKARGLWTEEIRDPDQAGRRVGAGHHRAAARTSGRCSAPRGNCRRRRSSTWRPRAAPYIDQSQSLNLFLAAPTIGKLSSMYLYAWKAGLKTTYYLRSRPATRIQQATVSLAAPIAAEAIACSLENPETCEACQ